MLDVGSLEEGTPRRRFADPTRGVFEEFAVTDTGDRRQGSKLLDQLRLSGSQASEAAGERLLAVPRLVPARSKAIISVIIEITGEITGATYPDLLVSFRSERGSEGRFSEGLERVAMEVEIALNAPARLPDQFFRRFTELTGVALFGCRICLDSQFPTYSAAIEHCVWHPGEHDALRPIREIVHESPVARLARGMRLAVRRFRMGDVEIPQPLTWHIECEGEGVFYVVSSVDSVGPFWSEEEVAIHEVEITKALAALRAARHLEQKRGRHA